MREKLLRFTFKLQCSQFYGQDCMSRDHTYQARMICVIICLLPSSILSKLKPALRIQTHINYYTDFLSTPATQQEVRLSRANPMLQRISSFEEDFILSCSIFFKALRTRLIRRAKHEVVQSMQANHNHTSNLKAGATTMRSFTQSSHGHQIPRNHTADGVKS